MTCERKTRFSMIQFRKIDLIVFCWYFNGSMMYIWVFCWTVSPYYYDMQWNNLLVFQASFCYFSQLFLWFSPLNIEKYIQWISRIVSHRDLINFEFRNCSTWRNSFKQIDLNQILWSDHVHRYSILPSFMNNSPRC